MGEGGEWVSASEEGPRRYGQDSGAKTGGNPGSGASGNPDWRHPGNWQASLLPTSHLLHRPMRDAESTQERICLLHRLVHTYHVPGVAHEWLR